MSSARGLVIEVRHLEFDEPENIYINSHNAKQYGKYHKHTKISTGFLTICGTHLACE